MQYVTAMRWQQIGAALQASVALDFALDADWTISLGGSAGRDFFEARSVDVDGTALAAAAVMVVTFNGLPHRVTAGQFHTYNIAAYQRELIVNCASVASTALLTFYPVARPEWR